MDVGLQDLIVAYAEIVREREAAQADVSRHPVAKLSVRGRAEGRPEGIASRVAADLGVEKRTVQRALARSRTPASVEAPPP